MGKHGSIAAAVLAVSFCTSAMAEDSADSSTYFSLLGSYSKYDEGRNDWVTAATGGASSSNIDEGGGLQIIFGQQLATGFGLELTVFADFLETDSGNGTDFYRQGLGVDLVYGLGSREKFTPFVLLGGGVVYNDVFPDSGDDYDAYGNAGLGLVSAPLNRYGMKLRAEVRYLFDSFQTGYDDYKAGIGLEIPLYGKPKVVEKIIEKVKVVEIQGEGGLSDADNDGIVDGRDQCPNTEEGVRVDGNGCPLGNVVALHGVTFETASDRLRPDAKTILDDVSKVMERYPEMLVEIAGHTDSIGSDLYNQNLSQKRAESVRRYLVAKGVASERMKAVGYGESEPVDTNETKEGRERNRRVELRINN